MLAVLRPLVFGTAAFAAIPAVAQTGDERSVEQYSCRDLVRESDVNRDTAITFLHGYLLGKSGKSSFDVEAFHKETEAFLDRCIEHPSEKAVDAMMAVKKGDGR